MINKLMNTIKEHGLYCAALTDKSIGITDDKGNVYDTLIVTDNGNIIDGNEEITLEAWLGRLINKI